MNIFKLMVVSFLAALPLALAQDMANSGAERSITYALSDVEGSGVTGAVFIGDYGENTVIVVALRGTPAGGDHPAHFHLGNCGSGGAIAVPLSHVSSDSGLSVTLSSTPYDAIISGDHYLNIHHSAERMGTIVACAEVGSGANPLAGQLPGAVGSEMTPVQPQEFDALRSAGYGLFSVENSGISGSMQVSETTSGNTEFVVTLVGITSGVTYAAVLYEGDCGPDRPEVLELASVSNIPGDPFASITRNPISYDAVVNGNHFLYIFNGGKGASLAACGEVGLGANQ